jgi:hypothetical protein
MVGGGGWLDTIFAGLVVAGVVVAVSGIAYGLWASHRNKQIGAIVSGDAKADLRVLRGGAEVEEPPPRSNWPV